MAILSDRLRTALEQRIAKNEQSILFLNRRGFARSLQCPSCGHVCMCPHCAVALTYHREDERLCCHVCGHQAVVPRKCPECKDPAIILQGYGTQKVEELLAKVLPKAKFARIDADAMRRKHALRDTLHAFKTHKIDILIGTQMIAKGLHFPNVTLVGILNADLGLHVPDFRAGERTFQLLTQVAGRAGRGDRRRQFQVGRRRRRPGRVEHREGDALKPACWNLRCHALELAASDPEFAVERDGWQVGSEPFRGGNHVSLAGNEFATVPDGADTVEFFAHHPARRVLEEIIGFRQDWQGWCCGRVHVEKMPCFSWK
jgi:hypothetical protein